MRTLALIAALVMGMGTPAAAAETTPLSWEAPGGWHLRLEASERVRGEFVDWFEPRSPLLTSRSDFFASRTRLGLRAERGDVEVFLQGQETILYNIPDNAQGPGGNYFANTHQTFQQEPILKQGWLRLRRMGLDGLSLKFGRILYSDGFEAPPTDPSLLWLTRQRIAERLIGPFEYTHVGRSFDGGQVAYDAGPVIVTGFGALPTAGGYEISANRDISGINVTSLAVSVPERPALGGKTTGRLFWMYYADRRDAPKVDNRLSFALGDREPIEIHTVGAHLLYARPLGPGAVDGLLWAAGQLGDWGKLSQRAWAYALEAGYRFPNLFASPWLRAGVFQSSGDDDAFDGTHETFFQMLPTARTYAQTPFYNLMNNEDFFAQLITRPAKPVAVRTDVHWLRLNESKDLFYSGGGATNDDLFGFSALPSHGRSEVALLVDLGVTYEVVRWLTLGAYYGHAFGQGVIQQNFAGAGLDYGYLEATVTY